MPPPLSGLIADGPTSRSRDDLATGGGVLGSGSRRARPDGQTRLPASDALRSSQGPHQVLSTTLRPAGMFPPRGRSQRALAGLPGPWDAPPHYPAGPPRIGVQSPPERPLKFPEKNAVGWLTTRRETTY